MRDELQNKLYGKYPEIFSQKDLPMNETCMCWGLCVGDGWYDLIDTLCSLLMHASKWRSMQGKVVEAVQVKEKFGGLRFYVKFPNGIKSEDYEYITGLIDFAESISFKICEDCGNPGERRDGGWIRTLCDSCDIKDKSKSYTPIDKNN